MKFGYLTYNLVSHSTDENFIKKRKNKLRTTETDKLFDRTKVSDSNLHILESDTQIKFKKLRKLIIQLQTKRLRNNAKNKWKYFTL